jgi:hypothetical protein
MVGYLSWRSLTLAIQFQYAWILIKDEILFGLWKKKNDVFFNENFSSHTFSWYVVTLISNYNMQTRKLMLKIDNLQQ